jgi:hypothetical protein
MRKVRVTSPFFVVYDTQNYMWLNRNQYNKTDMLSLWLSFPFNKHLSALAWFRHSVGSSEP